MNPTVRMNRALWRQTPSSVKWLLLMSFLMNMGFYALIPYLTLYLTGSFAWSVAMAGLVLGVRQFSQQGFAFLGGIAADTFGYKGTMILGILVRAVGFAAFAFCTQTWHFFVAAFLSGLGGSLFEPANSALYAVLTPEPIRKDVFAFRNVLTNIGIVGSQIAGTALVSFDFAWLSLFAGGLFALCGGLAFLFLPPVEAANHNGGFRDSLAQIVRDRPFLHYTAALIGFYYLYMQLFLAIPQRAEDVLGSKGGVGIVLATVSVAIVLFQMSVLRRLEGVKERFTLIGIGALVMAAGLFLLTFAQSLWSLMLDAFVFALGTMISMPYLVDMVPRFAPRKLLGAYYGFNGYSLAIGGSISTFFGGWVYDLGKAWQLEWLPWTICLLVGVLVALRLHQLEAQLSVQQSDTKTTLDTNYNKY